MENVSVFIRIRVLFWPEISALRVFFNFDNERLRPPKYQSAPPPPTVTKRLGQAMSVTVSDTHKSDDVRLKTCTHIFRACFSTNFDLYIIEYLRNVVMQCPRPSINALKCLIL